MRLAPVVPLVLIVLTTCSSKPPKPKEGADLEIGLVLAQENGKCVVRFEKAELKQAANAVAWTAHAVFWKVKSNACGEKKALGLKHLKLKKTGAPAPWFDRCSKLDRNPAEFATPPTFECRIPSAIGGDWQADETERVYEYEIEGDAIEPVDPDLGIKRNG